MDEVNTWMPTGRPTSAGTSNDSMARTKRMRTVAKIAGHDRGTPCRLRRDWAANADTIEVEVAGKTHCLRRHSLFDENPEGQVVPALAQVGNAAEMEGLRVSGVESQRLVKILEGPIERRFLREGRPPLLESLGILRDEPDGLVEVADGQIQLSFPPV